VHSSIEVGYISMKDREEKEGPMRAMAAQLCDFLI
jgi:hypothetical protein